MLGDWTSCDVNAPVPGWFKVELVSTAAKRGCVGEPWIVLLRNLGTVNSRSSSIIVHHNDGFHVMSATPIYTILQ